MGLFEAWARVGQFCMKHWRSFKASLDLEDRFEVSFRVWRFKRRMKGIRRKYIRAVIIPWRSRRTSRNLNHKYEASYLTALKKRIWHVVLFEDDGALKHVLSLSRNNAQPRPDNVERGTVPDAEPVDFEKCLDEMARDRQVTTEEIRNCFDNYRPLSRTERYGSNLHLHDNNKCTILYIAVSRGHTQNVEYILQHLRVSLYHRCGPLARTALAQAISSQEWDIVSKILGSSFMSPSQYINVRYCFGCTPLHEILQRVVFSGKGHGRTRARQIVEELLQHGADIDALADGFLTPLHLLVHLHRYTIDDESTETGIDLQKYLISEGAEVNTKDAGGMS